MLKTVGRQAEGVAAYRKAICHPAARSAKRGGASPTSRRSSSTRPTSRQWRQPSRRRRLVRRGPLPPRLRARQGDARRGPRRRGVRSLCRGQCAAAEDRSRIDPAGHRTDCRPLHRSIHCAKPSRSDRRLRGCATRYSSSACRAPDRPWSSRFCRRHSLVEGTAELPDIPALVAQSRDISRMPCSSWARRSGVSSGEEYLKRAGVQRRTQRPFFIDKLPNNWLYVPFIQLILPNAKIIDARRHPLGCCFSNFRQHFARGQAFTYDLDHLGRYYADYVRLMAPHRRGAAGPRPPRDLRADGGGHRSGGAGLARLLRARVRAAGAWSSTKPSGRCAPPARSRSGGRSIARRPRNGGL